MEREKLLEIKNFLESNKHEFQFMTTTRQAYSTTINRLNHALSKDVEISDNYVEGALHSLSYWYSYYTIYYSKRIKAKIDSYYTNEFKKSNIFWS